MADKIIDPFTNIPTADQGIANQGATFLSNLRELNIGDGTNVFRADADGIFLGAKTFATAPFKVTMAGVVTATSIIITGGTVRFGKISFTDNTRDGYYIGSEGLYFGSINDVTKLKYTIATGALDLIGTVSGRSTATLASAIDSSGHFIDANINTSAKTILDSFTFGASGAIQIGSYVNGVSGDIRISPNGIVARNSAGTNTIAINGATGAITAFILNAGEINGVVVTGGTIQTSALLTVDRVVISGANNDIEFWNSDGDVSATIFTDYNPINYMSGVGMAAGGGTYLSLSGKGNMGFAYMGIAPDETHDGAIGVVWDANDPDTLRIDLTAPFGVSLLPYGNNVYDLGETANKWKDGYFSGNIIVGGTVDGVDVAGHTHTGGAGGTIAHSSLGSIGTDDHHAQSHSHGSHTGIGANDHHSSTSNNLNITPYSVSMNGGVLDMNGQGIEAVASLYFYAVAFSPSTAGQMLYFDSGGVQNFRCKAGSFVGSVDLTAV